PPAAIRVTCSPPSIPAPILWSGANTTPTRWTGTPSRHGPATGEPMADDVLAHARLYLALGFAVLPVHFPYVRDGRRQCSCAREDCGQPAKHPFGRLVRNGAKDASTDPETVARWFTSTAFNIGIATGAASGVFALDIDPRHGGDEGLAALEAEHGALPATWR